MSLTVKFKSFHLCDGSLNAFLLLYSLFVVLLILFILLFCSLFSL
nr:MAG TPA: hypothetical protein [Bacteriophage sp.]